MDTDNPLAVVTGASSGIGYALAEDLAGRGFDLVIAADGDDIRLAGQRLARDGISVEPVRADLATPEGVTHLWSRIEATGHPVEIVVINAGMGVSGDFTEDVDLESELRLIDLNVRSAVHLAKLVLPGMVRRGHGRALFTSSMAAAAPVRYEATYAASKAFVYSFSEAVRYELRDAGVTVTALLPGPADTGFFARTGAQDTRLNQGHRDDPALVAHEGIDALLGGRDHIVAGSLRNPVPFITGTTS